tara:strand:+ start:1971 stop:2393 length:423 start_codon:yes stop_codon:yes gene_type:complete
MEYEMKEGQGSLWHETNCKVLRKGKIKIEGEERYASILEYTHNDGTKKYELVFSAGLLNLNAPEDKRKETSPDIGGAITFNNIKYKFGGWRNSNDSGAEWTGVRLTPKEEGGYNQQGNYNEKPFPKDEPKDEYFDESAPF